MPSDSGTWLGTGRRSGDADRLTSLSSGFEGETVFQSAQPLTVTFRGAMIRDDREPALRGGNDLLMVTKFQFGDEPPVDRLHYLGKDDGTGWHGEFFRDRILSVRDLTERELTIRVQIYDIDGVNAELVDAVQQVASQAAVTFPQLSPYAGAVGLGIGPIVDLVNNIDDHDAILESRVKLEIAEPNTRTSLLQPGYFVHFPTGPGEDLRLDGDLRVRTADGAEYTAESYAILEVAREYRADHEWEITQKAAKLIAELNGRGQSGKAALDFLRDTLDAYSNYRRLDRAKELASKASLTADEKRLLEELRADPDLDPYLRSE